MARGGKRPGSGRPKGSTSPDITKAREAIAKFCDLNAPQIQSWFDTVAKESPERALEILYKYLEFHVPKLSRQEQQPLDKDGKPTDNKMLIEFVGNNAPKITDS